MKSLRFMMSLASLSLCTMLFAQAPPTQAAAQSSEAQKPAVTADPHQHNAASAAAPKTEAQKSFEAMKGLAGEWEGPVKTDYPGATPGLDSGMHVSMRVTSRGNVLVEEFQQTGTPLDASKYDHPVTMLYLDNDQLNLVHYCDAGNRPHMTAKASPDGKTFEFQFTDLSGSNKYGHMNHAVFTIVDANHHTEEWLYMAPGDKPIHAFFNLQRTQPRNDSGK